MNCSRGITTNALSKQSAAQVLKSLNGKTIATSAARPAFTCLQQQWPAPRRQFSTSKPAMIKEFFPAPDAPHIKTTEAAWPHPVYTREQMEEVRVAHRNAKTWSDYFALTMVRILRTGLDFATGYKHDHAVAQGTKNPADAKRPLTAMTERKWLVR